MIRSIACLILLFAAASAEASVTSCQVCRSLVNSQTADKPAGFTTYDILIDTTSNVSGQQMRITLTSGSIYQTPAPFGSNTAPFSGFIQFAPQLPFDTFVTMGAAIGEASFPVLEAGGAVNIAPGNATKIFDTFAINITWAPATGVNTGPVKDFMVARITLSDNANGTWSYYGTGATGVPFTGSLPIVNGLFNAGGEPGPLCPIPEPGAILLSLLGLVGVTSIRKLRR